MAEIVSLNYNFLRNRYSKQLKTANLTIVGEGVGVT